NTIFFLEEHAERLMNSAQAINLDHPFSQDFVQTSVQALVKENKTSVCNIKLLLIGGSTKQAANLYIMCLNPLFVDRSAYKEGVHCITENHERDFPQAKTLNMLPSYL